MKINRVDTPPRFKEFACSGYKNALEAQNKKEGEYSTYRHRRYDTTPMAYRTAARRPSASGFPSFFFHFTHYNLNNHNTLRACIMAGDEPAESYVEQ